MVDFVAEDRVDKVDHKPVAGASLKTYLVHHLAWFGRFLLACICCTIVCDSYAIKKNKGPFGHGP